MTETVVSVGVAGGSGSGKTTVVETLVERLGPERAVRLAHDRYYRDVEWSSAEEIERYNFDHPRALETDLLVDHLRRLKQGETVAVPLYDFVRHRRLSGTERIEPREVVVVDGVLVLAEEELRRELDLKVYVDTAADLRLVRRLRRDIDERGREVADVLDQYEATVRPMHLAYVEPSRRWADLVVTEGGENEVAVERVMARIEALLESGAS